MSAKKSTASKPASHSDQELIITRVFDAPRKLVWRAWTDAEQFKQWWGPKAYSCPACRIDFRVGGKYLACMRSPEGQNFWSTGVYREIIPMERIVFTDSFADEKGNVVPGTHYGLPTDGWPLEFTVTLTFKEAGGKTTMTLHKAGIPKGRMSEMEMLGWNESFDKLVESLQ